MENWTLENGQISHCGLLSILRFRAYTTSQIHGVIEQWTLEQWTLVTLRSIVHSQIVLRTIKLGQLEPNLHYYYKFVRI